MSAVHEKSIADLLEEQRKTSSEFTKENFGLQLGADYPEMARELLASNAFIADLSADFVLLVFRFDEVLKTISSSPSAIRLCPAVYNQPLKYLYWGIQIGRLQEKQMADALQAIAQNDGVQK